jgi:hypothetical protein
MKKSNISKTIIQVGITLVIFLIVSYSCKRELSESFSEETDPGAPLPTTSLPEAFPQRTAMLMSSHEISGKKDFPANAIYEAVSGSPGKGLHNLIGPMLEVGSFIFEICDYTHTESRFDAIDNKLDDLSAQIGQLDTLIQDLGATINLSIDELTSFYAQNRLDSYVTPIINAMSPGNRDGLLYWSNTASAYQKDTNKYKNSMEDLKGYAPKWADKIYNSSTMPLCIQGIHDQICPPTGVGNNVLKAFTKTIIENGRGVVRDEIGAMNAYQTLESYFLTVVNYQFQAASVHMNAAKMFSTNDLDLDVVYWTEVFCPTILEEIKEFQKNVDNLVVNLAEYRSQNRFEQDMQYSEMGIAPDRMFYHVLARSQFVSNLLCASLGVTYNKVSGHILVPTRYLSAFKKPIDLKIGNMIVSSKGDSMQSILPYTSWKDNSSGKKECNPAYMWSVFHFAVPDLGKDWTSSSMKLQLLDDPKTTAPWSSTPWVHSKPITGEVTILYYNPMKAGQSSPTKNESCNFQFGYFAGSWQWGDLYLSNSTKDSLWYKITKPESDYYFDFENFNDHLFDLEEHCLTTVPFAVTHSAHNTFTKEKGITFSHQDNKTGSLTANGKTTTAKEFYILADGHYAKVRTGNNLPKNKGEIKAYVTYNVFYGMAGSEGNFITVNIGTKRKIESVRVASAKYGVHVDEAIMNGDIVSKKWTSQVGLTNSGFGSKILSTGTNYEPGIQYYYQTVNLKKSVTANVSLLAGYQFVYEGYNDMQ